MKKLAIIAALMAVTGAASATDLGLRGGRNFGSDTNSVGVTLGQKFGDFGAELAFDRGTSPVSGNRYSLIGSYDVAKYHGVTFTVKAGAAIVEPSDSDNGYAALAGFGVSYPVYKNVSLVADYSYQQGQDRVHKFNGNTLTAGIKYSF
jgi:outer membrane autotransporter protein